MDQDSPIPVNIQLRTSSKERVPLDEQWLLGQLVIDASDGGKFGLGPREMQWLQEAVRVVAGLSYKNIHYGDSYARGNSVAEVVYDNCKVRLGDKLARLQKLAEYWFRTGELYDGGDEAIEDTIFDIAGYALLMLAYIRSGGKVGEERHTGE